MKNTLKAMFNLRILYKGNSTFELLNKDTEYKTRVKTYYDFCNKINNINELSDYEIVKYTEFLCKIYRDILVYLGECELLLKEEHLIDDKGKHVINLIIEYIENL